ncbi:MAG: hypothetical protein RL398_1665 [Planctomycetota bacterium]|jgi:hypothetical protein
MSDAACQRSASWRLVRSRCAAFVAALALAIVLAVAGVPAASLRPEVATPVVCVVAERTGASIVVDAMAALAAVNPAPDCRERTPHEAPPTRRIDSGGLPPTRAP